MGSLELSGTTDMRNWQRPVFATLSALAVAAWPAAGQQASAVWAFEDAPGGLPAGFQLAAARQASPGVWRLQHESGNGVYAHQGQAGVKGFSLSLAPMDPLRDVDVSVRLKFTGTARAGGVVWRYQDENNFYMAVLDLTGAKIVLSRVVNGNRIVLEYEDDLELDVTAWHTLKVSHAGPEITVRLGGIRVFQERDRYSSGGGGAGLVALGESDVWFDDLRVEPERRR